MTGESERSQRELKELQADCARVARKVANRYRAVEPDDLAQELFLEAWRAGNRIQDRDRWLQTAAENLANDMHEKTMKCRGWSQYEYTSAMVRKVLEYSFTYKNWERIPLPDSARSAPRTARAVWDQAVQADVFDSIPDPTDARDVAADVQSALDLISLEDRLRIIKRYKYGEKPEKGAETTALYRAVDRLTAKLNSYKGIQQQQSMVGRRAMTNAAAMARISSSY